MIGRRRKRRRDAVAKNTVAFKGDVPKDACDEMTRDLWEKRVPEDTE